MRSIKYNRRESLKALALAAGSFTLSACTHSNLQSSNASSEPDIQSDWGAVRDLFNLDRQKLHFASFVLTSHPAPVRREIERLQKQFDSDPMASKEHFSVFIEKMHNSAATYLKTDFKNIAFTDSTTMGLGLLYNGIKLSPGQEILVSDHDFYSTKESLRLRASNTGALVRKYELYKSIKHVSEDEILTNIRKNIKPQTRVLAATWVQSDTGLKIPVKGIGEIVADANRNRDSKNRLLFCIDGVHGLGVEEMTPIEMGCDYFAAGTHKAIFGPRGTGILWAKDAKWPSPDIEATIPSFFGTNYFGQAMSPGGMHTFDYRWVVYEAFDLHLKIGKNRIEKRIHSLATQMKQGLLKIPHVDLITPLDERLSAGLIGFEIAGMTPENVVQALARENIVSSVNTRLKTTARLFPSLLTSEADVEIVLKVIQDKIKA